MRKPNSSRLIPLIAAIAVAVLSCSEPGPGDRSLVFRDVRLFDGLGVHGRTTVVVRNGRIESIAPDTEAPRNAEIIDGTGHTLIPGFIDSHFHIDAWDSGATGTEALEQALILGVTTALDLMTPPTALARIREAQLSTGNPGLADLFAAGSAVTSPRGHGAGRSVPTLRGPEGAAELIDRLVAEGSDFVKIVYIARAAEATEAREAGMGSITRESLGAAIEAAHLRGRLTVVHVNDLRSAREAIELGADGLAHVFFDSLPDPEFIALVRRRGAFVIPTLAQIDAFNGNRTAEQLLDDERISRYLSPRQRTSLERGRQRVNRDRMDRVLESVGQLHGNGVPILAGSDADFPGTAHGASLHGELALLVEAGLSPVAALTAATATPARIFGLEDRGRIAPGRRADVVLVRGDPTDDIRATREIVGVWKAGHPVERDQYLLGTLKTLREAHADLGRSVPSVIGDFENGQPTSPVGSWLLRDDWPDGGSSVEWEAGTPGANGTGWSLDVHGEIDAALPDAWAGVTFTPFVLGELAAKSELAFWVRGENQEYRVRLTSWHEQRIKTVDRTFVANVDWSEVRVPFADFDDSVASEIYAIQFLGPASPGSFAFQLDEVRLR